MSKEYAERTVTQKVNNGDGTQTEITVKERRLKKLHDKQMSRLQSRKRRAAAELNISEAAKSVLTDENASTPQQTLNETPKANRRKKPEPWATTPADLTPETESPAADSETGDAAAQ